MGRSAKDFERAKIATSSSATAKGEMVVDFFRKVNRRSPDKLYCCYVISLLTLFCVSPETKYIAGLIPFT